MLILNTIGIGTTAKYIRALRNYYRLQLFPLYLNYVTYTIYAVDKLNCCRSSWQTFQSENRRIAADETVPCIRFTVVATYDFYELIFYIDTKT